MDSNDNLQIKALVKETVMLFIILGKCRKQALVTLTFDNIIFKENKVICSDVNTVLTFMHGMYLNGCLYSGLSAAHGELSSAVKLKDT